MSRALSTSTVEGRISASTKASSIAMQPPWPIIGELACAASPMSTTRLAVDWQSGADREPAHGRGNTVGADDEVVRAGGAVAEFDGNAVALLAQRRDGGRKTAVHGGAG